MYLLEFLGMRDHLVVAFRTKPFGVTVHAPPPVILRAELLVEEWVLVPRRVITADLTVTAPVITVTGATPLVHPNFAGLAEHSERLQKFRVLGVFLVVGVDVAVDLFGLFL